MLAQILAIASLSSPQFDAKAISAAGADSTELNQLQRYLFV
jgi:hypothetical protein